MDRHRLAHSRRRPRLAVWKFSSCDGCQLSLLNCEDQLLALAEEVRIAYFPEATRARAKPPYDLSLVEGSISTPEDVDRIQDVRRMSKVLVAIGACATAGGIQALRNFQDCEEFAALVYPHPNFIDITPHSTPISDHVVVDFELRGCPVNKDQLLKVIAAWLHGRRPDIPRYSVCVECKLSQTVCVMVANRVPCLGPVTQAGCGAICPRYSRGCYGCFGPKETVNTGSLRAIWRTLGISNAEITRAFRTFNAWADGFREEGLLHEE